MMKGITSNVPNHYVELNMRHQPVALRIDDIHEFINQRAQNNEHVSGIQLNPSDFVAVMGHGLRGKGRLFLGRGITLVYADATIPRGTISILPIATECPPVPPLQPGSIAFNTGATSEGKSTEVLRFEADGRVYVHGSLTTHDPDVVEGVRDFLRGVHGVSLENLTRAFFDIAMEKEAELRSEFRSSGPGRMTWTVTPPIEVLNKMWDMKQFETVREKALLDAKVLRATLRMRER